MEKQVAVRLSGCEEDDDDDNENQESGLHHMFKLMEISASETTVSYQTFTKSKQLRYIIHEKVFS